MTNYFFMRKFLSLHFELTHHCNLRCKHCYNIDYLNNEPDLSLAEVKKIIDIAYSYGINDFGLSGGEPFARDDIVQIIKYIGKNVPIHILSNGLLIKESQLDELLSNEIRLVEFRISLDGLNGHKKLRNVDYQLVLDKITLLKNKGFIVTINTMITNFNIFELESMYSLIQNLKVDRWRLDFVFNSGNAKNNTLEFPKEQDLFPVIKNIILKYTQERPLFELDINKLFRSAYYSYAREMKYSSDTYPCGYQKALTVRPNGDVSFCPSTNFICGNILKQGLEEIQANKKFLELENFKVADLPNDCHNCKYLSFCGGGCRADAYYENGHFHSVYKNNCSLIKYYCENIRPLIIKEFI